MFIGNLYLIEDFKKLIREGGLTHGYIFFGESEVGKLTFAEYLANFLENNEFDFPSRILTDAMVINKKEQENGIESVKKIKTFLQQKPLISKRKTAIIDEADKLTPEAQNFILKIAEEPPSSALIILIVNHLENLFPPLLSRLQKIYFERISEKEIEDFLVNNFKISGEKAKKFAEVSCGRAGRAVNLLNNNFLTEVEEAAKTFLKISSFNRSQLIKKIIEIQKEKPEFLDYFIEFLIVYLRKDPVKNFKLLKEILSRLFLIKSYNTNKRLQIEAFNF